MKTMYFNFKCNTCGAEAVNVPFAPDGWMSGSISTYYTPGGKKQAETNDDLHVCSQRCAAAFAQNAFAVASKGDVHGINTTFFFMHRP